jgi:hypothetical protein
MVTNSADASVQLTLAELWNGSRWSIRATPNPGGGSYEALSQTDLNGVSCVSRSTCVAVGSYANAAGSGMTLVERWNGSTWSTEATPALTRAGGSVLNGIACPPRATCTAVGSTGFRTGQTTLSERSDHLNWSIEPSANPSPAATSALNGVSCPSSTTCMAVGGFDTDVNAESALAELWNGSRWSIEQVPSPQSAAGDAPLVLNAVSCTAESACTAVGTATLIAQWNGSAWSSQEAPSPGDAIAVGLNGVSCASSVACTAVGSFAGSTGLRMTLVEQWNGSTWSIQSTPNPPGATYSSLNGVSCSSPTACTAVGNFNTSSSMIAGDSVSEPLVETWDGTNWSIEPPPTPPGGPLGTLNSVSCTAATACTAVGSFTSGYSTQTLAASWNGSTWSVQPSGNPPGAMYSSLNGVSCASANSCTAVGSFSASPFEDQETLAEAWNGTNWSLQSTPNPGGGTIGAFGLPGQGSILNAAACTSPAACTAVGSSDKDDGTSPPLSERYG